eukprot:SAG31_NODE_4597_length_3105_cov_2.095143_2_plen_466_part_00
MLSAMSCAALLFAALLAQVGGDAQTCSSGDGNKSENGFGWRENATHVTAACNIPVIDAGAAGLPVGGLVQRLAAATTPLLIRGLFDHSIWREARALGNRSALLEDFGDQQVQLSVATLLSNGPKSTKLDGKKLSFMQQSWGAVAGSILSDRIERQVRAGEPRPRLGLREWLLALREGTAPADAYVFHNVSGGPIAQALAPLHKLWLHAVSEQFELREHSHWRGPEPPALMRLGVGGSGSGAPFHDHDVIALNVAFAGRKRWLITRPCRPTCRIPSMGGAALYHPKMLLSEDRLPSAALAVLGAGGETWDCTQHPGEVIFVPEMFLHATINLEESVAVAVQCDDGADPRSGLSHLNALIVHANGAASALGPCGTPWDSPFQNMERREAQNMLEVLENNFRGDPEVFLNRAGPDGRVPVDVAVEYGSVHVASALAAQGGRFLPSHILDAQQHGHTALATFIETSLKT